MLEDEVSYNWIWAIEDCGPHMMTDNKIGNTTLSRDTLLIGTFQPETTTPEMRQVRPPYGRLAEYERSMRNRNLIGWFLAGSSFLAFTELWSLVAESINKVRTYFADQLGAP